MSDEKNVFDFHGLSDDEELERLLESVRRDIGEASPEPSRRERTPERGEISGERSARPEPPRERPERTPERAATPASRQSQLNQPRPSSHRAVQPRTAVEEREAPRRRPEVQRDGLLHIRLKNGKKLELRYPKEYSVKIEHKDTPDEKLHLVWGEEGVHRIILTPEEAGESGTAEFVIRKSEE